MSEVLKPCSLVFIRGRFPGLNEIIDEARRNKYDSAKQKSIYTEMVKYSVLHLNPVKSAHFTFTWFEKDKRRNPDNIIAGQKYIFDGLQAARIIKNDGWSQVLSINHKFKIGEPGVLIEIKESNALPNK